MPYPNTSAAEPVYRIDKFKVPATARDEFLNAVRRTHRELRGQRGFVQDFLLEQAAGPGEFNFITFVEWRNRHAMEAAATAMQAIHRAMDFDPGSFIRQSDIEADIAVYRALPVAAEGVSSTD